MLVTQFDAFKNATATGSKFKTRGSNMRLVDDALEAYWAGIHAANIAQQIQLLNAVISACLSWLKTKVNKADTSTSIFGNTTINTLFVTRKTAIKNLCDEALTDLFNILLANFILTPDQWGKYNFDKKKLETLGQSKFVRPQVKPMGPDYQPERGTYLASNKTQAISGSGVHQVHQFGHQQTKATIQGRFGNVQAPVHKAFKKNADQLTNEDFAVLDALGRANMMTGDVNYLKKNERYQFMAIPEPNGQLWDYNNNAINTDPNMVTAYAMDKYGNLFVKDAGPLNGAYFFNHSSFNAGNDVISAGTLTINNGLLQMIDNNSGHYKPTRDNLHNCLEILDQEGVDLTQAIVNLYLFQNNRKEEHKYTANHFLANQYNAANRGVTW